MSQATRHARQSERERAEQEVRYLDKTLRERAEEAWARTAERQYAKAADSLRHQLFTKLKISRDEFEVEDRYSEQWRPHLRVAATADGIAFCLNKDRALSIINWRCSEKGCEVHNRRPVHDWVSLGEALAEGSFMSDTSPKCEEHSR